MFAIGYALHYIEGIAIGMQSNVDAGKSISIHSVEKLETLTAFVRKVAEGQDIR